MKSSISLGPYSLRSGSTALQRGVAAARAGNAPMAVHWFRQALLGDPTNATTLGWLGQSLCAIGDRKVGTEFLENSGRLMLGAVDAQTQDKLIEIISQLQHWGSIPAALSLARAATANFPYNAKLQQLLAAAHSQLNNTSEALLAATMASRLAPDVPMFSVFQASLEIDGGELELGKRRINAALVRCTEPSVRFRAYKELARIAHQQRKFDKSFEQLEYAALEGRKVAEYARFEQTFLPGLVAANTGAFDRSLLKRWAGKVSAPRTELVFLMGFMRSGTTLVQTALGAHSAIFVADEGNMLHDVLTEINRICPRPGPISSKIACLTLEQVQKLRELYWKRAHGRYGDDIDKSFFIDKFAMSSIDVAVINCIFPDARIIFLQRDPRDVCISCFSQLMVPTAATRQLLQWRSTASFYSTVSDWWLHIREILTLPVLELRYEDLVESFDSAIINVLGFLGLEWEPAITEFHVRARSIYIASPSRNQVTQPIYDTSVGRWKDYAKHYASINDIICSLLSGLGYDNA